MPKAPPAVVTLCVRGRMSKLDEKEERRGEGNMGGLMPPMSPTERARNEQQSMLTSHVTSAQTCPTAPNRPRNLSSLPKNEEPKTYAVIPLNSPAPRSKNVMLRNPNSAMNAIDLRKEAILLCCVSYFAQYLRNRSRKNVM
jgi:hypothetical protein